MSKSPSEIADDPEAFAAAMADVQRDLARRAAPAPVAPGFDITGMPAIDELARHEASAKRRLSPRRLIGRGQGWTQLEATDRRVAELDQRHQQAVSRLG